MAEVQTEQTDNGEAKVIDAGAQKALPKIGTVISFYPAAKEVHSGFAYYASGEGKERVGCYAILAFGMKNGNINCQVIDHGGRAWTMADVPYLDSLPGDDDSSQPLTGFAAPFDPTPKEDLKDSSGEVTSTTGAPTGLGSGSLNLGQDPASLRSAETTEQQDSAKEGSALGKGFGEGGEPEVAPVIKKK